MHVHRSKLQPERREFVVKVYSIRQGAFTEATEPRRPDLTFYTYHKKPGAAASADLVVSNFCLYAFVAVVFLVRNPSQGTFTGCYQPGQIKSGSLAR